MEETTATKFRNLLNKYPQYPSYAYDFIYGALSYTNKNIRDPYKKSRHVTAEELLEVIRKYALEKFGCLTEIVLDHWNVRSTRDIGNIVFHLVEYDLMGKQEGERIEDFDDVYRFEDVFNVTPNFEYNKETDEWTVNYVPAKH